MEWVIVGMTTSSKVNLMKKLRFNLTVKLMLVASTLFAIPFVGYYYIDGMEELLRKGQEQNLMGNARGLATALHERPNLFNKHANFKKTLETGKDFFPTKIHTAIALDGNNSDWQQYITAKNTNRYDAQNQIKKHDQQHFQLLAAEQVSVNYQTQIGRYKDHVYAFFTVVDDEMVFRRSKSLKVSENDHLELATINQDNELVRYIFSNYTAGWTTAYLMPNAINGLTFPEPENRIQGTIKLTAVGYNIELRIPNGLVGEKFGFHISDYDNKDNHQVVNIGTTNTEFNSDLGTFTVPSKQIERIIEASKRTHSSIRVVDIHYRELLKKGDLENATGAWINGSLAIEQPTVFSKVKNWLLEPFYKLYLVKPAKRFVTEDFNERKHQPHISNALTGTPDSYWWKSKDNKAVILSAAHPIYLDGEIEGVVIVEETTHGIRSTRNKAIEGIIITSLLIAISVFSLFIYSLMTSIKIRKLRNQVESAVDEKGSITQAITPFTSNDEIGDVSRSMATIIGQLGQYNDYLQTMSSRLSHELKTPIAVVRSSLEMLENQELPNSSKRYMKRAKEGINRLNSMLLAMAEATHLEQALQTSELEKFDLAELIDGCSQSYQQVYKPQLFNIDIEHRPLIITGSDEHISQLFDKLISNAVEFSQAEQTINIGLKADYKSQQVILTVENIGPSLPSGMSKNIFDAMVSIRDEEQKNQPHLGIGLYICRLICQYHQGSINATNFTDNDKEPKGVIFTVRLPLAT